MIKLKKIIAQLDGDVYNKLETELIRTRGDNFLYLLRAYRNDKQTDDDISSHLKLSSNSFYVLKSRLLDKIQEQLSGDLHSNKEEVIRQLHRIPEMCFSASREVATAFLQKLEKDLLYYDMHNELLVVYSALKQIHLYSDKYFQYSQLYNKHIAFSLSIEKSTEMLGNFNRLLRQYDFSRSQRTLDTLVFLNKGINDHLNLNPSRQIEIIRNLTDLQLDIFCDVKPATNSTEFLLRETQALIDQLPESSQIKTWTHALDELYFEFHYRAGRPQQARIYFEKVQQNMRNILLYTGVSVTSMFLRSRIGFLQNEHRTDELKMLGDDILSDPGDEHAIVLREIHNAMALFYSAHLKQAAAHLNDVLNNHSFKEYVHITAEIKLTLAWIYIRMEEYGQAAHLLKNLQRKIKSEENSQFENVLYLIRIFNAEIKDPAGKPGKKDREMFDLFKARNKKEARMLDYLLYELKKKFEPAETV